MSAALTPHLWPRESACPPGSWVPSAQRGGHPWIASIVEVGCEAWVHQAPLCPSGQSSDVHQMKDTNRRTPGWEEGPQSTWSPRSHLSLQQGQVRGSFLHRAPSGLLTHPTPPHLIEISSSRPLALARCPLRWCLLREAFPALRCPVSLLFSPTVFVSTWCFTVSFSPARTLSQGLPSAEGEQPLPAILSRSPGPNLPLGPSGQPTCTMK